MSKRIGVIGGSFDPLHFGHLVIAQDAVERLGLSEVVFIPAAYPPHKLHVQQADARHRLEMIRLAVAEDSRFSVSDIELRRGGVSYTIDTVLGLKEERPLVDWVLIVGSDTLVELHSWYKIDELLDLCEIASFLRPGEADPKEIAGKVLLAEHQKQRLLKNMIEAHLVEISSTEIRQRVADGRSIRYLVPPAVEEYIFKHRLYRG